MTIKLSDDDTVPSGGIIAAEGEAVATNIGAVYVGTGRNASHTQVEVPKSRHLSDVKDFVTALQNSSFEPRIDSHGSGDFATIINIQNSNIDDIIDLVKRQFGVPAKN